MCPSIGATFLKTSNIKRFVWASVYLINYRASTPYAYLPPYARENSGAKDVLERG
jgi:hypothetical protein